MTSVYVCGLYEAFSTVSDSFFVKGTAFWWSPVFGYHLVVIKMTGLMDLYYEVLVLKERARARAAA